MVYVELLSAGLAAGFLAGLLGIGGGFVVVPVLLLLLPQFGLTTEITPHVAIATSLAAMVPTALSAVLTQHRRGYLDLEWVLKLAPWAAIAAFFGSRLAQSVDGLWVTIFFAAYAGYFALKLLCGPAVASIRESGWQRTEERIPAPLVGASIGLLSAIAGVCGASMTVPYMLFCRLDMRRAVAVSSAVGLLIAVGGGTGFLLGRELPEQHTLVGLVCWPAALTLAVSAIIMAPHGVAASHRLPVRMLKRAFGGVLLAVCIATTVKVAGPVWTSALEQEIAPIAASFNVGL